MAVSDHGNFDLAIEVTEELLTAALLAQFQPPTIPSTPLTSPQFTVLPQLTVAITMADCRSGGAATVALVGTVTGSLLVQQANLPGPLPPDPKLREIAIDSQFTVLMNPTVGSVGGTRGLVFVVPTSSASLEVTLNESAALASFPIQALLVLAYLTGGGQAAYQQRRTEVLTTLRNALNDGLRNAVSGLANVLAIGEPSGVSFRAVLTTASTLKLLITVVAPDGNPALVSGATVRRNSLGGPLDHCVLVMSNAHFLGSVVFPALTGALGIPGTPSRPGHPCLLLGGPLPAIAIGGPPGAPPATVSLGMLLGQVDTSGLRVDVSISAVSPGGFATVTLAATVTIPITATIAGGALTVGLGVPAVTTTTDIAINPAVYALAVFTGGHALVAVLALIQLFGGGFIDSFIRTTVVPSLFGAPLPSMSLPLAGPFAGLTVNTVQTAEAASPGRSIVIAGITIPIDRVNDVFIRML